MHKRKVANMEERKERDTKRLAGLTGKRQLDLEGNLSDL